MTSFTTTVRADCAVSGGGPRSVHESFARAVREGAGLWTGACLLPQLPASEIKQTFLPTTIASLLTSEQQVAGPQFWQHERCDGLLSRHALLSGDN